MTREKYESLPLATLKDLAKARKMRDISTMKKSDLIDAMLAQDEKEKQEVAQAEAKEEVKESFKEKKEETRKHEICNSESNTCRGCGRRRSDRKDWKRIYGADRSGTG